MPDTTLPALPQSDLPAEVEAAIDRAATLVSEDCQECHGSGFIDVGLADIGHPTCPHCERAEAAIRNVAIVARGCPNHPLDINGECHDCADKYEAESTPAAPVAPAVEEAIEGQWSGSDASFLHWTSCASARYEDGTCDCSAREAIMRFARNVAIVARQGEAIKAGDTVRHKPSGEYWTVMRVANGYVYPAGWPSSSAPISECELDRSVTKSPAAPVAPAGASVQEAREEVLLRHQMSCEIAQQHMVYSEFQGCERCAAYLANAFKPALDTLIAAVRAEASGETGDVVK